MDGLFYIDSKMPFNTTSAPTVTLLTTHKALTPTAMIPILGPNYFNYAGKAVRTTIRGTLTTVATPGNLTLSWLWGSNADNVGTTICATAVVWTANLTNKSWFVETTFRCRSIGATGSMWGQGYANLGGTGTVHIPDSGAAAATVDFTTASYLGLQATRSGSTAETMTVTDILYEALN